MSTACHINLQVCFPSTKIHPPCLVSNVWPSSCRSGTLKINYHLLSNWFVSVCCYFLVHQYAKSENQCLVRTHMGRQLTVYFGIMGFRWYPHISFFAHPAVKWSLCCSLITASGFFPLPALWNFIKQSQYIHACCKPSIRKYPHYGHALKRVLWVI